MLWLLVWKDKQDWSQLSTNLQEPISVSLSEAKKAFRFVEFSKAVALVLYRISVRSAWHYIALPLDWWSWPIKGETTHLSLRRCSWHFTLDGTRAPKWKNQGDGEGNVSVFRSGSYLFVCSFMKWSLYSLRCRLMFILLELLCGSCLLVMNHMQICIVLQ